MPKERILITGGAGYLGSVMTKHFLDIGHKVTCLDNLRYHQISPMLFADDQNYEFVFGDVRDSSLISKLLTKVDLIIPLAAIVGMPACNANPEDARTINQEAIINLDKLRSRSQRIIYPTTNSGYGAKTGEVFCTEETPLEPISLYGETKAAAEKALLESDKPTITLRLATVFGLSPRMRTDLLVNDFVKRALEDKYLVLFEADFKRNYIHIKDVARGFQHCNDNFERMQGTMYNLGLEDANLSKRQLAQKIKKYIPDLVIIEAPVGEDPDKRNYVVSNKKIRGTGFSPMYSLDQGIQELIKGYLVILRHNPLKNI